MDLNESEIGEEEKETEEEQKERKATGKRKGRNRRPRKPGPSSGGNAETGNDVTAMTKAEVGMDGAGQGKSQKDVGELITNLCASVVTHFFFSILFESRSHTKSPLIHQKVILTMKFQPIG
jgi:hypothetical protein